MEKSENSLDKGRGASRKKGLFLVLLSAVCWGTLPAFSRYAYANGSDPLTAAAWRAYLSAGIFFIWFLLDGTLKKFRPKDVPFYLTTGIFAIGGTFILYMKAVELLSTAMASILLYTGPAFVILLSRLFYKEPITRDKLIGLLCTFGGCALVTRVYDISSLRANWQGVLLGLGSGFCYSLTTVIGGKKSARYDGRQNAGLMIIFCTAAFLFVAPPWKLSLPTFPQWIGYLGVAVIGSVLAYGLYMSGLETGLDGGIASISATIEPVVATVLGVVVFGDSLEWLQALGIAIVLAGVALPQLTGRKKGAA